MKITCNLIFSIFMCFLYSLIVSCNGAKETNRKIIVSLIKENDTKSYNSAEKGFLDQIALDKLNVQINNYTSDGNDSTIIEIANKVHDDNSTIAVVIGENAVLTSMNIITAQSIIFAGGFDDISIKLIENSREQNNNITGVYSILDMTKYLKSISPLELNSLGYLYYNEHKIYSSISEKLKNYCLSEGISYHELLLEDNDNFEDLEKTIISKNIDYLYLSNEDTIKDNIYNINSICDKYSIPIINTDIESALNVNVLFSLDINYYYLGRQLALLLSEVIKNGGTKDIDFVELKDNYRILLNEDVSKFYNIPFSKEILDKSTFVIRNSSISIK